MPVTKRVKHNPWPFSKAKTPTPGSGASCARRSEATITEATKAAYKAGHNKGDTGLFTSWLCERGLQDRGKPLVSRLRTQFEKGVEDAIQESDRGRQRRKDENEARAFREEFDQDAKRPKSPSAKIIDRFQSSARKAASLSPSKRLSADEAARVFAGLSNPKRNPRCNPFLTQEELDAADLEVPQHHIDIAERYFQKILDTYGPDHVAIEWSEGDDKPYTLFDAPSQLITLHVPYPQDPDHLFAFLHETAHALLHNTEQDSLSFTDMEYEANVYAIDALHREGVKLDPDDLRKWKLYVCDYIRKDKKRGIAVSPAALGMCEEGRSVGRNPKRTLRRHLSEGLHDYDSLSGGVYKYTLGMPSTIAHAFLDAKNPDTGGRGLIMANPKQPWTVRKERYAYQIVRTNLDDVLGYGQDGSKIYAPVKEYRDSKAEAIKLGKEWHRETGHPVEVFDPNTYQTLWASGEGQQRNPHVLTVREIDEWTRTGARMGADVGTSEAQQGRAQRTREEATWILPIPLREVEAVVAATYQGYREGYEYAARNVARFALTLSSKREADREAESLKRRGYQDVVVKREKGQYGAVFMVRAMSPDVRRLAIPQTARKENPYVEGTVADLNETIPSEIPVFQGSHEELPGVVPFVEYTTLQEAMAYAQAVKGLHPDVGVVGFGSDEFAVVLESAEVREAEARTIEETEAVEVDVDPVAAWEALQGAHPLSLPNPAGLDDSEHVGVLRRRLGGAEGKEAAYIRAVLKFYDSNGRLPALTDERSEYGVSGHRERRGNPEFRKLNSFLGEYGGKVYYIYETSDRIQGIPIKYQGAWGESEVEYSDGYDWHRAHERRVHGTNVITVPWAGGTKEFVVYSKDTFRTLVEKPKKVAKVKAPKGAETYHGYYYKRVSTPWGMKYYAGKSPEDLVYGREDFSASNKSEIFRLIDEYGDKSNPKAGKRNPGLFGPDDSQASADRLYEDFHGRPPSEHLEVVTEIIEPDHLCTLGSMVSMKIETVTGYEVEVGFEEDPPYLCSSTDGTQLYFQAGNQAIDLKALKMDGDQWERHAMVLGELTETTYRTQKSFDKFKTIDYYHANAEESGIPPQLLYDPINRLLSVAGGRYKVLPEGIVD